MVGVEDDLVGAEFKLGVTYVSSRFLRSFAESASNTSACSPRAPSRLKNSSPGAYPTTLYPFSSSILFRDGPMGIDEQGFRVIFLFYYKLGVVV